MKKTLQWKVLAGLAMVVAMAGCGPGEITREVEYDGTEGVEESAESDLLGDAAEPPPDPGPPPIDLSMENRPVDENGEMPSDLELLNEALEAAIMHSTAEPMDPAKAGKTMEEQMNADPGAAGPQIRTMEDLVKIGVIKAVPEAPAGKKYAIEGGTVVLVDAQ